MRLRTLLPVRPEAGSLLREQRLEPPRAFDAGSARPVYLTDGRSRQVRIGNCVVVVKHVAPKELPVGNRTSATVLQALRHLGKDAVISTVIGPVRKVLSPRSGSKLLQDARYTTDWITEAVRKIAGDQAEAVSHG